MKSANIRVARLSNTKKEILHCVLIRTPVSCADSTTDLSGATLVDSGAADAWHSWPRAEARQTLIYEKPDMGVVIDFDRQALELSKHQYQLANQWR